MKIIKLLLFSLLLMMAVSMVGCKKKPSKTRSIGYKCYLWKKNALAGGMYDTTLETVADFPYPMYPIQDQEDSLNAYIMVHWMWATCSY